VKHIPLAPVLCDNRNLLVSRRLTPHTLPFGRYNVLPNTNLSIMIAMCLGRIYSITMLANLNRRQATGPTAGDELSRTNGGRSGFGAISGKHHSHGLGSKGGVTVQLETHVNYDSPDLHFDHVQVRSYPACSCNAEESHTAVLFLDAFRSPPPSSIVPSTTALRRLRRKPAPPHFPSCTLALLLTLSLRPFAPQIAAWGQPSQGPGASDIDLARAEPLQHA
jgi:hypothetical protein